MRTFYEKFIDITLLLVAVSYHTIESFAPAKVLAINRVTCINQKFAKSSVIVQRQGQQVDIAIAKAPHIDDTNHQLILNNPHSLPTLVDCYTDKCGPCRLIGRSLEEALPKFTIAADQDSQNPQINHQRLQFVKWDVESTDNSQQFMTMLREHEMTFHKLPTLILFVDGIPVALKSGMMSAAAIDRFLEKHLPDGELKNVERRPRVGPNGALGVSTRKMNR